MATSKEVRNRSGHSFIELMANRQTKKDNIRIICLEAAKKFPNYSAQNLATLLHQSGCGYAIATLKEIICHVRKENDFSAADRKAAESILRRHSIAPDKRNILTLGK